MCGKTVAADPVPSRAARIPGARGQPDCAGESNGAEHPAQGGDSGRLVRRWGPDSGILLVSAHVFRVLPREDGQGASRGARLPAGSPRTGPDRFRTIRRSRSRAAAARIGYGLGCGSFADGRALARPSDHHARDAPQHRPEHPGSIADSGARLGPGSAGRVLPLLRRPQGQLHPAGLCGRPAGSVEGPSAGEPSDREVALPERAPSGGSAETGAGRGPEGGDAWREPAPALAREGVHRYAHRIAGRSCGQREPSHRHVLSRP